LAKLKSQYEKMDKKYHFSELFAENPIIEEKDEEA